MANALLVGSRAAKFWFADARKPADDFDLFIYNDVLTDWVNRYRGHLRDLTYVGDDLIQVELRTGGTIGFDNTRYPSVQKFLDINAEMPTWNLFGIECAIASPESLLAIKRSHVTYRHNWLKHIKDYTFLKSKGLQLTPRIEDALSDRLKEREARNDFKKPKSLNAANSDFFARSEQAVRRRFVHDELHLVMAYGDKPMYTKAKHDQSKAMLSQDLFETFTPAEKCQLVREEAYVIGLERIVIPTWYNQYTMKKNGLIETIALEDGIADKAYEYALMRISTDLTSGWFRDFAVEHYGELRAADCDFVGKFTDAFDSQRLKFK